MTTQQRRHHVVVVGGGFGGLNVCRSLRRAPVTITLVDRRNFHLFQPLLYQVATGGLSPANIASPLRAVLKHQKNVEVLLGDVAGFDVPNRRVLLTDGELHYDSLVVAAGVRHHYFGHPEWEHLAPGLKALEDATEMRRRLLLAFETAERLGDAAVDPDDRLKALHPSIEAWLTFVVVGAGPTGVELAGAIGELAQNTLRRSFRRIQPGRAKVLLIEGLDRVLSNYPPKLCQRAEESLRQLGVTVRTNCRVTQLLPNSVAVSHQKPDGAVEEETIHTHTVFWAAGVQASPLGKALAESAGAELDRVGRVMVRNDCSLPDHPEVFVIGDLAHFPTGDGKDGKPAPPLPGVAPVAIQQGQYVARKIARKLERKPTPAFHFRDKGSMATIGRGRAVAMVGKIHISGILAWLAWLFIHLMYLVGFQNRILVLMQWAWNYITRNRTALLITGEALLPDLDGEKEPVAAGAADQAANPKA